MNSRLTSRRRFLGLAATGAVGTALLAACQSAPAPTAQPVEKEVTRVVEKPVTQVVEKQVTAVVTATAAPKKEVVKPTLYISTWAWPSMKTVQHRLFAEYTKAKEVTISFIEFIGGVNYDQWLTAQAAARDLPDVVMGPAGAVNESFLKGTGEYVDLAPYLKDPNPYAPESNTWADSFVENTLDNAKVPGPQGDKVQAYIPLDRSTMVLYIWDEPFKKAGFTLPIEDYPTWVKAMDAIKKQGLIPFAMDNIFGRAMHPTTNTWIDQIMRKYEPQLDLNKDGVIDEKEWYIGVKKGIISYDDPGWQGAVALGADFQNKYYSPGYMSSAWPKSKNDFVAHKAAVFDDSSWFATDTASPEQRGFDWDPYVQHEVGLTKDGPLGQYVQGPPRTEARNGFSFAVPAGKANEKQIIDFLQYILAPKTASMIADQTLLLMPLKGIAMKHPLARFLEETGENPKWNFFWGLTPEFNNDGTNFMIDFTQGRIDMKTLVSQLKKLEQQAIKDVEAKHSDWAKAAQ